MQGNGIDTPLRARVEMHRFGNAGIAKIRHPPRGAVCAGGQPAGAPGDFVLFRVERRTVVERCGREMVLEPGDACFLPAAEPFRLTAAEAQCIIAVLVSRPALLPMLRNRALETYGLIPKRNEMLVYLERYHAALWNERPLSAGLRVVAANHIHDLVALILCASTDGPAAAKGGLAAARFRSARDYVSANFQQPGLSLEQVAGRQGVSSRYLRRLFEQEGTTFGKCLRDCRLDRALQMLRSPHLESVKISAIAYDCGFGELSNFNHAFRQRFGVTPSEARETVQRGGVPGRREAEASPPSPPKSAFARRVGTAGRTEV